MKPLALLAALLLLLPPAMAEDCGCFSKVPLQPADGVYTVSAELPDKDCFWMYLAGLRAGEKMGSFLRRAMTEAWELKSQYWKRARRTDEHGYIKHVEGQPEVMYRGIMLRNPQADEAYRDIPLPEYRDNMMDFAGNRARLHYFFLSVELYPAGIKVRQGKGFAWDDIVATGAPMWWPRERAGEFFSALPELLSGDPAQLVLPLGIDELPCHLQERIRAARRMVMLYADEKMPAADCWEWWARIVQTAGPQCVEYTTQPGIIMSPSAAEARQRISRIPPELRELQKQEGREPHYELPPVEVEPQLELPMGE